MNFRKNHSVNTIRTCISKSLRNFYFYLYTGLYKSIWFLNSNPLILLPTYRSSNYTHIQMQIRSFLQMESLYFLCYFECTFHFPTDLHSIQLKLSILEIFQHFRINRNTYQGFVNLVGFAYCELEMKNSFLIAITQRETKQRF